MPNTATHTARTAPAGLRIRRLRKRFDDHRVLDQVDLDVAAGELVAVLGLSGSGKTTLLRLICGFEAVDAGTIELGGRRVAEDDRLHIPAERRGIGYVAQEGALFPHLSVQDNILFGLPRRIRNHRGSARATRVEALLALVGLPAQYAWRYPATLSGGEQQRVALARALAPEPAVVLLDEPFSALDAGLRADTRQAVAASLRQVGTTAILVTHDQDEALSMGDRVAVLQGGRFVQVASPQTLYAYPSSPAVARFVGDAVLVVGTASGGYAECCFGRLPLARQARHLSDSGQTPVDILIRPEQFRLERLAPNDLSQQTARVENLNFYGHDAGITLRVPDGGPRFTATVPGFDLPAVGQTTAFRIVGAVFAYPRDHG